MPKKVILFDIDGTLADIAHRRGHLDQDKPDWKSFNAEMGGDTPNAPIVTLYKSLWTLRPDNDFRADHIIKEEILNRLLAAGKIIEFVVDDRQQVVDMWRRNGITCLQCDIGDF